ncbi:MAG: hypothetical protein AAB649_05855, partial [Patescibacteria group bacterium]
MIAATAFIKIPVKDLTVSLDDFQGREAAFSQQTFDQIVNPAINGTLNISAIPPIKIWMDSRMGKYVIIDGHSRTAAFTALAEGKFPLHHKYSKADFKNIAAQIIQADTLEEAQRV